MVRTTTSTSTMARTTPLGGGTNSNLRIIVEQWDHWAVTRGAGAVKTYKNGVLVHSQADSAGAGLDEFQIRFGHEAHNGRLGGRMQIDDAGIWYTHLCDDDIAYIAGNNVAAY